MTMIGLAEPVVMMSEAQAYVRIETGEEEAVLAGLIRTASALCEAFLNQIVIARTFSLDLPACASWQRLELTPVRSIDLVETIDTMGVSSTLSGDDYMIDIDSSGDAWVRLTNS